MGQAPPDAAALAPVDKVGSHSLLRRQIKRHLGAVDPIGGPWARLLEAVDEAYRLGDADRAMLERALEISSQELLQANLQTRAMLQATPYLFLRVTIDGTVLEHKSGPLVELFCSHAAAQDSGQPLVLRPDFLEQFQLAIETLKGGAPLSIFDIEPRDGGGRMFEVRVVMLSFKQTVVVIRDITDRKRAEDSLRESEQERKRSADERDRLFNLSVDLFCVGTFEGWLQQVNPAWTQLLGWTVEELTSTPWLNFVHPDDREATGQMGADLVARKTVRDFENRYRCRDGSFRWLSWNSYPLVETRQVFAVARDITERKKLEQQFLRAQRMESIGTLAGGIAHDLNNVLTPILMSVEMLTLGEVSGDRLEMLSTIEASARRAADMVGQVLSFARGVEGRRLDVQVRHLLREVEKIANDTFLKHIEVHLVVPSDVWVVSGDPTQLHQVLINLCVNARDAMPDGGTLNLSAANVTLAEDDVAWASEARPGRYVMIQVGDSGTGMPQEIIDKIFEPFFTTKELGKGTGLGLSTSLAIVKSHGGFIRVYSEPGKGTTIRAYLPAQTEPAAVAEVHRPEPLPRGNGELILVVDDEVTMRQVTQRTLERFGYRVMAASGGAEAVALYAAHQNDIAVVLTDMMMPLMDGPALIKLLVKMRPDVRIMAVSGLSSTSQVADASGAGVRHFLSKPYSAQTLLTAVKGLLHAGPLQ